MAEPRYKVVNGEYIELTVDELQGMADRAAEADLDLGHIRQQRNGMLGASDWTQIGDASLGDHTAEEWRTYRQALRDLLATYSRASEVVWPNDPPTQVVVDAEEAARLAAE